MYNKQYLLKCVLVFVLLFTVQLLFAQGTAIKGMVKDIQGQTIPGVNVFLEGTTIGTVTDISGQFALNVPNADMEKRLVFSFIGFVTQKADIPAKGTISIVLIEDIQNLEEFVVVGYGTQKRSDVTGAVTVLDSKEIKSIPVARIDQALQGKVPGVTIATETGAPGADVSVRIRGVGTINNNDPLYVVDGVPTKSINNVVSPNDIESMTVLKDGASAAIYGSRAGNGVVLVKTKSGNPGAPKVSYNGYFGIQSHGDLTPMANTEQYMDMWNEAALNDGRDPISLPEGAQLSNTNWLNEIFRTAMMQSHQVNVSGGDDKTRYYVSGTYFDQDGIILNSDYNEVNIRSNISSQLNEHIKVGLNLNYSNSKTNKVGASGDGYGGNGGSVIRYAYFRTPATSVFNPDGSYQDMPAVPVYSPDGSLSEMYDASRYFGDGYNPVGLAEKFDWTLKSQRLFGNAYFEASIIDELIFRSNFGVDAGNSTEKRFNENWGTNGRINSPNSLEQRENNLVNWDWYNTLSYRHTFNKNHNTNFLLGMEAIRNSNKYMSANDRDFPDQLNNMRYLGNGLGIKRTYSGETAWSLLSYFGKVGYNFKSKYFAEAVIRADGSSRFAPGQRWGAFYSGALSWNMHEEQFMKDLGWFSQFKLRATLGQTGNQEVNPYSYESTVGSGYDYPFGGTANYGYTVNMRGNENTTWETTTQFDLGADIGLLDNQLIIVADYFNRLTDDMLVQVPQPAIGGTASVPFLNAGSVRNTGLELEVFWRDFKGDFQYEVSGNIAFLHNEVVSLSDGVPIAAGRIDNGVYATLTEEGYPIGSFYLYEMDGIYQNELDIFTSPYQGKDVQPGDVKYRDLSGPNGVPDGIIDEYDRTHCGSAIPKFTYGLNVNMSYKNWDFSMFWNGVYGNKIYWQIAKDIEGFYRSFNITEEVYENHWTGEGTSNEYPRASWMSSANNNKASTRFLKDGSYLRLKNIQIGYSFGDNIIKKLKISGLRIYFSGENLLTITKYPGLDPEMTVSDNLNSEVNGGDLAAGIDWGTYPVAKVYTLGINLNL